MDLLLIIMLAAGSLETANWELLNTLKNVMLNLFIDAFKENTKKLIAGRGVKSLFTDVETPAPSSLDSAIQEGKQQLTRATDPFENPDIVLGAVGSLESVGNRIPKGKLFTGLKGVSTSLLERFRGLPEEITQQRFNEVVNQATKTGLKKADKDLVTSAAKIGLNGRINLSKVASKVEEGLVPLTPTPVKSPRYSYIGEDFIGDGKYGEIIYQSPIKTSAGDVHFPPKVKMDFHTDTGKIVGDNFPNYFSHVRFEDLADGKTRKILETQSDLMQKENFAREFDARSGASDKSEMKRLEGLDKLEKYFSNDPLAQLRTFREEVKRAAKDGKDTILIPSGETAMKIEGLGERNRWMNKTGDTLSVNDLKVGEQVTQDYGQARIDDWIITDILGDGKFKAVPKDTVYPKDDIEFEWNKTLPDGQHYSDSFIETFDISGKVDSKHFVYKLNEEAIPREARKMGLTVEGKITEGKGDWWKINVNPERAEEPVSAFGKIGLKTLVGGATAFAGAKALFTPSTTSYTRDPEPEAVPVKSVSHKSGIYGEVHTLNVGIQKGDKFIPTEVIQPTERMQKTIDKAYISNPDLPKGLLEALLMKESSMGSVATSSNSDIGKFAYLAGFTKVAKAELIRNGIIPDLNTHEGVLQAVADYWRLTKDLKDENGNVIHTYNNWTKWYNERYSSGKLKPEALETFDNMLQFYANPN